MPSLFQFALIALTALTAVSLALCLILDRSPRSERPAPAAAPEAPKPEQVAIVIKPLPVRPQETRVAAQPEPASLLPRLVPPLAEERPVPSVSERRPSQERAVQPGADGGLRQERDAALERGDSLWDLVVHLRDQVEQLRAERHAQEHEIRQLRAQLSGADPRSVAVHSARMH